MTRWKIGTSELIFRAKQNSLIANSSLLNLPHGNIPWGHQMLLCGSGEERHDWLRCVFRGWKKKIMVAVGCLITSVFGAELQWVMLVMFLVPRDKYLTRNKLREGGSIFYYKQGHSLSLCVRHLATLYPLSGSKKRWMLVPSLVSPFNSYQDFCL